MRVQLWASLGKWWRFFRPVAGWKQRYREYKGGRRMWPIPGKPNAPKAAPWPIEWIPHTQKGLEGDDKWERLGWKPLSAICSVSGVDVPPGQAASCLRCGVSLSPVAAGQCNTQDPPRCSRCAPLLLFVH